jgi:hypothetical protein
MRFVRFAAIEIATYGGLVTEKHVRYRSQDLPLGPSDVFFQYQIQLRYHPIWGDGASVVMSVWCRRGDGRISGGTRVFESAAESREAALGYGARSTPTSPLNSSRPKEGSMTTAARRTVATG